MCVLKGGSGFLLDSKNNAVGTLNAYCSRTTVNSFKGILNLEEVAIRGKDSDSFVVSRHVFVYLI
jgi:hypothetical protein